MKIEIFEKARQLGIEIAASDEFKNLQKAKALYEGDAEVHACVARIDEMNEEMDIGSDDFIALRQLEKLRAEVAELKEKLSASQTLRDFQNANQAFDGLMDEVNQVIGFVIAGEAADAYDANPSGSHGAQQVH